MEEMLMYAIYFGAGFLFGDLFRFHFKKGRKLNGKMEGNAGSVSQPGESRGKGNPGKRQNGAGTGTDDPAQLT